MKTVLLGIVFVAVDESLYSDTQYTLFSCKKDLLNSFYTSCKTLKIPIFVYRGVCNDCNHTPSWSSGHVSQLLKIML